MYMCTQYLRPYVSAKPRAGQGEKGNIGQDTEPGLDNISRVGHVEEKKTSGTGQKPVPNFFFFFFSLLMNLPTQRGDHATQNLHVIGPRLHAR